MQTARVKTLCYVTVLAFVALLLIVSIHVHFLVIFWGDQDWELLVARMWLDGKKLYIDHVPVTAPLLFYLYAVPVMLSRIIPALQDYQALFLCSLGAIGGVLFVCNRLVTQHAGFHTRALRIQFAALLCFLLIIRIPSSFFGDREHILIVLTLPYFFRWMPGLASAAFSIRMRLLIGIMAAIGFCIKPHCLLVFAGLQLVCILRNRNFAILNSFENRIIYAFGLLYALGILLFTPQYLTTVVPMAFYTYSAIRAVPGTLFSPLLTALLAVVMLHPRETSPYRRDMVYFIALLPFLYLYVLINNGWPYTFQPLMTMLLLINGFALWEFLWLQRARTCLHWRYVLGVVLCLVNFGLKAGLATDYFYEVYTHRCRGDSACTSYYQPFLNEINTAPQAHSFGVLGMDFVLWARVAKLSGAAWDTRFPQLWMMPKFFIADDAFYTAHQDIITYTANALAEDLDEKKPDLLFVEISDTLYRLMLQRPLDWVGDFSAVPAFKQAFSHYALLHRIDNCNILPPSEDALTKRPKGMKVKESNCRYDVYRRKDQTVSNDFRRTCGGK